MNAPLATFALLIVILVLLISPSPMWRMILLVAALVFVILALIGYGSVYFHSPVHVR
jgi:hypothetical protein